MSPTVEERRLMTVWFAEISGFADLVARTDLEDLQEINQAVLSFFDRVVTREGGVVHKYDSGRAIALFGFPHSHEDDPERSVRSALITQQMFSRLKQTIPRLPSGTSELGLKIGVHSGIVFVGEVGAAGVFEQTVMGDTVNYTSRLKDLAARNETIVSESVFRRTAYLIEYDACPEVLIKGLDEPQRVFRPTKIRTKPHPKRGIASLSAPLVGRDAELTTLRAAVQRLREGKGGALFVLGEAGIGKSRLRDELREYVKQMTSQAGQPSDIRYLESQCLSYGESTAFWPVLRMIEMVFEITPDDRRTGISSKIVEGTKPLCPDRWQDVVPYLAYLFDVRFEDELDDKVKYLDAQGLKTQIVAAVQTLFSRLADLRPVLMVIDDWHWIDAESLEVIDALMSIPRLMVLGLARTEKDRLGYPAKEALRLRLGDRFEEMVLKPFDQQASTLFVENLLQQTGLPRDWTNRILETADGNPFYIEEILRSFIDRGILRQEGGKWSVHEEAGAAEQLRIPETIQAVVSSRLDYLDPESKRILQMASVIGRTFGASILERLSEEDRLILSVHLASLEEYEYIVEVKRKGDPEYAFRHATVQQVSYDSLTKGQRKALHGRTGAALEVVHAGRLGDYAEALAFHYSGSDNVEKALEWLSKAGSKAKARYANREAIQYYRRVLEILDARPENEPSNRQGREEAYMALAEIYRHLGEYDDALEYYRILFDGDFGRMTRAKAARMIADIQYEEGDIEEALRLIDTAFELLRSGTYDETIEKAELYALRAWIYQFQGRFDRAVEEIKFAQGLVEQIPEGVPGAKAALSGLLGNLGAIYFAGQQYEKSVAAYAACLQLLEQIDDKFGQATHNSNLANVYFSQGEYDKALLAFERHLQVCTEVGYKTGISVAANSLACIHAVKERFDEAIRMFEWALGLCEELRNQEGIGAACGNLASVCVAKGEFSRAVAMAQRDLAVSTAIGNKRGIVRAHTFLAEAYLEKGEYEPARRSAEQAIALLKELGDTWRLAINLIYLAEIERLEQGDLGKAVLLCEEAQALAEETDPAGQLAIFHFVSGKVAEQQGDLARAEQQFEQAMNKAQTAGRRRLIANILQFRAGMARNRGDLESARKLLNSACAIYDELGLRHKAAECMGSFKMI